MFEKHPVFNPPKDENVKIWRYVDFTKFLFFIDRKALFFTRVDQLEDKFEGTLSKYMFNQEIEEKATGDEKARLKQQRERFATYYESQRKRMAVNCWHMNEYESAAMWKLYIKSNEGIAIQSTYRKFVNSFHDSDEYFLWVGMVNYIDYNKEIIPRDNFFQPYIYKRKSFEHERELRAVIARMKKVMNPDGKIVKTLDLSDIPQQGVNIPTKILDLIESIYVSPMCEKWFEDLIRSVLEKYDIKKTVIRSSLADDPIF